MLQQGFSFPQMLQGENVPANLLQLTPGRPRHNR